MFFGLAVVFAAVGAVTSVASPASDSYFEGTTVEFSSGQSLKSVDPQRQVRMIPDQIKDQEDVEHIAPYKVDPSSTTQNIHVAVLLLLQAVKTVPFFSIVSFALSFLFIILYLDPISTFFGQKAPATSQRVRVSRRSNGQSEASQRTSAASKSKSSS